MSPDNSSEFGEYKPDPRLADLYEGTSRKDDDVLETVCPSFKALGDAEERYHDQTFIGRGGLKEVYKIYDRRTCRWVAMARLRSDRGLQFYDIFVREAWLIASLRHPNIIKVHDAGVDDEQRPFFTMDLRSNRSLLDWIGKSTPDGLPELLEIFQKICDAISYSHSEGVVHLDLKPENIQCNRFGEVLVCDWGLGRKLDQEVDDEDMDVSEMRSVENVTLMGRIKGSPGYMAPEQIDPESKEDERTDIYSLGCILHTVLCGVGPFSGSMNEVLDQTVQSNVRSLRERFPERQIPDSLEAVVLKATARNPEERYDSVVSLRQDIQKYMTGFATVAEQPGFMREARLFISRNRMPLSIISAAIVALSLLSILFINQLDQQQLATEEERSRADQLLSDMSLISYEYDTLFEQQAVSKKELAEQVARSAGNLKNLAFFERPLATFDQSKQLLQMALELDPECQYAHQQLFSLYCIQLNYSGALSDPLLTKRDIRFGFTRLALAYPNYEYNKQSRPSNAEMINFFREGLEITPRITGYMERVFAYQAAIVKNREGIDRELAALLEFYNGGKEHFSMTYDPASVSMTIRGSNPEKPISLEGRSSRKCLLSYIPVRSLSIDSSGRFDVISLDNLDVEFLDISGCKSVVLEKPVMLPHLRRIRLHRGQIEPDVLREFVHANDPFEVIEIIEVE